MWAKKFQHWPALQFLILLAPFMSRFIESFQYINLICSHFQKLRRHDFHSDHLRCDKVPCPTNIAKRALPNNFSLHSVATRFGFD